MEGAPGLPGLPGPKGEATIMNVRERESVFFHSKSIFLL